MVNIKKLKKIKAGFSAALFSICFLGVFSITINANGEELKKVGSDPYVYFSDESNIERIWPIFGNPITDFDIKLKTFKDNKEELDFEKGDNLDIQGEFTLLFNEKRMNELISRCSNRAQENCDSEGWSDKKCSEIISNLCTDNNGYTIDFMDDLGVYAQIWKKDKNDNGKGDHFIDEFYIAEGIDAKVGDVQKFQSSWKIPEEIPEGDYYISIFINGSNSFNIKGHSSIIGVKAVGYSFKIVAGGKKGVQLDKNNIKFNGTDFNYPDLIARMTDKKKLKVEIHLVNLDNGNKKVDVTYEMFKWSQEDQANSLKKKQESINIAANGKKDLVYEENLDDGQVGVYILLITATDGKSISKGLVRFGLKDDDRGIMLFLGVAKSPEGIYYPMFCPRNAQREGRAITKFKIELLDRNDKEIAVFEDEGVITPVAKCFLLSGRNFKLNGLDYVKLRGTVTGKNEKINDQREIEYNFAREGYESVSKKAFLTGERVLGILAAVIIILILGVLLLATPPKKKVRKKKRKKKLSK